MSLELQLVIISIASFGTGVLSGISGGGGGFIMLPLLVAIGLPPQIAVGTMKMGGIGAAFGGLSIFAKSGHIRKDLVYVLAPIGIVIGLVVPFIFQRLDSALFQDLLGIILILMAPTLLIRKAALTPSRKRRWIGYVLYSIIMFLVALFSSGVGSLGLFVLVLLLGTSKIEANATKRAIMALTVPVTFIGLFLTGYVSLVHGLAIMIAGFLGTHVGSKLAMKRGERFVTISMVIVAIASGIWFIVT